MRLSCNGKGNDSYDCKMDFVRRHLGLKDQHGDNKGPKILRVEH
jgi:hypothetical protein